MAAALETPRSFGLFSIRERLDLLGGRLEIVSQPGRGTEGHLSIPVAGPEGLIPPGAAVSEGPADYAVGTQDCGSRAIRILVADDHAEIPERMEKAAQEALLRRPDARPEEHQEVDVGVEREVPTPVAAERDDRHGTVGRARIDGQLPQQRVHAIGVVLERSGSDGKIGFSDGSTAELTGMPDALRAGDVIAAAPAGRGVYAVRTGPVLAENIRRAATGKALTRYQPQQEALYLISTGEGDAVGTRNGAVFTGEARFCARGVLGRDDAPDLGGAPFEGDLLAVLGPLPSRTRRTTVPMRPLTHPLVSGGAGPRTETGGSSPSTV